MLSSLSRASLVLAAAASLSACGGSGTPADRVRSAGGASSATANLPTPDSTLTAAALEDAEDFYRAKTVTIVVGSGPGGGFDTTARLVSRHLGRHLPGSPTIIVVNMPGGGGLVATNHLFNAAPRDGTVVGIFAESQVINQLTGTSGVQFDFRAFNWLGSSYVDPHVCLVRSDAAMTDFRSMIGSRAAIAVGATGPGSNTYAIPRLLAVATGANFKVVSGYQTTSDVRIAVERGEVHGMCLGWESVRSASSQWLDEGYAQVLVQVGLAAHPDLPDVPVAIEFAKDTASRMLLQLVDAPGAFAKPFALPPGVDPARVHLMRRALQATYRDPAFLAEARSMKLEFQPKTAADIQRTVTDVLATPPDVAARYRQMVEP